MSTAPANPQIELRQAALRLSSHHTTGSLKSYLLGRRPSEPPRWILDHVDFSARTGDRIGVLGFNGAGKTTLMRVIAGIYPLVAGSRVVNGRISPVMTTGLGLDPELTVRENVRLGLIYTGRFADFNAEIEQTILDFAELTQDADKLFKHLSSGYRARLGFAIVVCQSPEILLLDEVFATGDLAFVDKAKRAMRDDINKSSITVMVSNSPQDILEVCNRVIIVDAGRIAADGDPATICADYRQRVAKRRNW